MNKAIPSIQQAKALSQQQRNIELPFLLTLSNSDHNLMAERILRVIPQKRLVIWGEWKQQAVVAKLFFGKSAQRHYEDDKQGIYKLKQANILSPHMLYTGCNRDHSIYVLIFEAIEKTIDINQLSMSLHPNPQYEYLLKQMVSVIAQQHNAGCLQQDLHPNNFLWSHDKLYTIDGGKIKYYAQPIPRQACLNNIALFCAQFTPDFDGYINQLMLTYTAVRHNSAYSKFTTDLAQALHKQRRKRLRKYLKKIFRPCTDYISLQTFNYRLVCTRKNYSKHMQYITTHLDQIFRSPQTLLKAGRSSTVIQHSIDNKSFVIKRYNMKSPLHYLKRCAQPTRAACAWANAHRLLLLGIATAQPIAFVEKRFGPLRGTSYFISEHIVGPSLLNLSLAPLQQPVSIAMADKIQKLLLALWQQSITHGDLKASNILIDNDHCYLIDLDGMRCHRSKRTCSHYVKRDIKRFLANWEQLAIDPQLFSKLTATEATP